MPASEVKKIIGIDIFNSYFVFCVEREPVDTNNYVDKNGNLLVNKILKYEYLSDELNAVSKLLGFKINLVAKAKTGFREKIYVSNTQKEVIYDAFSESLAHTKYKR